LKSLAMMERLLGSGHPGTATSLMNLAEVYRGLKRYGESEALLLRARATREADRGPQDRSVMDSLGMLTASLLAQGRLHEGSRVFERALALEERILGTQDPRYARDLDNYARLLVRLQRSSEAQRIEQRLKELLFRRTAAN
jgi:tetratricopeptide (TPR) repeat protein